MKSGNLNFLEPSGPLQVFNGNALPFTFWFLYCFVFYLFWSCSWLNSIDTVMRRWVWCINVFSFVTGCWQVTRSLYFVWVLISHLSVCLRIISLRWMFYARCSPVCVTTDSLIKWNGWLISNSLLGPEGGGYAPPLPRNVCNSSPVGMV